MVSSSSIDMTSMIYPINVLENNKIKETLNSFVSAKERNPWYSVDFEEELTFDNVMYIGFA